MLCALILAGGSGKRFWPLSTEKHPKQLLKLFSDKTMIRETVDRILPLIPAENIFIATNIIQAEEIKSELPMISEENIIVEPLFKDTAAAVGYGVFYIKRDNPNATLVVLPSDHSIKNPEIFRENIEIAAKDAERHDSIVTLGIKPTRPEVGYGYIKVNNDAVANTICKVQSFHEKPSFETAEEFLAEGSYLWNSGMYVFKISTILKEIEKYLPKHYRVLKNILFYLDQELTGDRLANKTKLLFEDFEKVSIDYGIMEKSAIIKVIPSEFGWNDIGSYTAFEDVYECDENGNILRHTTFDGVNSSGNIILTENLEIKAVGLENIIVVQSGNKLLLCNKYQMDEMKKIV
jgi:mannose-1-phosphate guanylyltransferase